MGREKVFFRERKLSVNVLDKKKMLPQQEEQDAWESVQGKDRTHLENSLQGSL